MYYLIMTIILWQQGAAATTAPTIQMIEFRDEGACRTAATRWKAGVLAARQTAGNGGNAGPLPSYALSAECVPSDSTSRIK